MQATTCKVHKLVADVAVLTEGRVLMVRYSDTNKYDHQSGWFLPDDLLANLEHPEAAARRILKEQMDLSISDLTLGYIQSFKGGDGSWHMAFHYVAQMTQLPSANPSPDVKTVEWFSVNDLPPRSEVAHHGWALRVVKELTDVQA